MVINKVNSSLSKLIESYRKWIIANPQLLADIENIIRCLSYFSVGGFNKSSFATEVIYSLSNLLVLFNDLMIYSSKSVYLKSDECKSKIKIWLTVVEYTETVFEISAKKFWGESGKWLVIAVIQIFKTVLRLTLVHIYNETITKSPPIQPLNRDKSVESVEKTSSDDGFTLKRTGTVVRSIRAAKPVEVRSWEPLTNNKENITSTSTKNLLLAENLYIVKPLVHLGCLSVTGDGQWPPWLLSFALDVISLKIINKETAAISLNKEDRKELLRRRVALLTYILRSPFYDKYSRVRIYALLNFLSAKLPLAGFVAETVKKYLPHWQSIYFSMWSC